MAYALVAKTAAGSSNGTNVTTSAIDTTGANLLLVFFVGTGTIVGPPTDSKGNTWTALTSGTVVGGERGTWYYVENPIVGFGHTFSWTQGTGSLPSIIAFAFSGAPASSSFDQESGNTTFGTTLAPGSLTPSVANCLVVQGLAYNTASTDTIGESYNYAGDGTDYVNKTANAMGASAAYKIQTTATATNPTWTASTATSAVARAAVFKPSGGAPVTPTGWEESPPARPRRAQASSIDESIQPSPYPVYVTLAAGWQPADQRPKAPRRAQAIDEVLSPTASLILPFGWQSDDVRQRKGRAPVAVPDDPQFVQPIYSFGWAGADSPLRPVRPGRPVNDPLVSFTAASLPPWSEAAGERLPRSPRARVVDDPLLRPIPAAPPTPPGGWETADVQPKRPAHIYADPSPIEAFSIISAPVVIVSRLGINRCRVGDVGTRLTVRIVDQDGALVDLTNASSMFVLLRKPNGTVLSRAASIRYAGPDGRITYTTVAGDIDRAGVWKIQGRVTIAGKSWSTELAEFLVKTNLDG